MLATLLIIRQFMQNLKEVLQPYLYERHRLGELTLRAVWDLLVSALIKYGRLAVGRAHMSPSKPSIPGQGLQGNQQGVLGQQERHERKCLNGGCGVPDEEAEEDTGARNSADETEEENTIDCGLKLRKVSFIEKVERKSIGCVSPIEDSFLEEGSPTMVEKGMDPALVFEMCDDDDDSVISETKEQVGESAGPESSVPPKLRKRGRSLERADSKSRRESWMDPPEEQETTTLTQAEIESCMQTYEVNRRDKENGYGIVLCVEFMALI